MVNLDMCFYSFRVAVLLLVFSKADVVCSDSNQELVALPVITTESSLDKKTTALSKKQVERIPHMLRSMSLDFCRAGGFSLILNLGLGLISLQLFPPSFEDCVNTAQNLDNYKIGKFRYNGKALITTQVVSNITALLINYYIGCKKEEHVQFSTVVALLKGTSAAVGVILSNLLIKKLLYNEFVLRKLGKVKIIVSKAGE